MRGWQGADIVKVGLAECKEGAICNGVAGGSREQRALGSSAWTEGPCHPGRLPERTAIPGNKMPSLCPLCSHHLNTSRSQGQGACGWGSCRSAQRWGWV